LLVRRILKLINLFTTSEIFAIAQTQFKKMKKGKSFLFSDKIKIKEVDDNFFIEGFISSTDSDLGDEIVMPSAQQQLIDEINTKGMKIGYAHQEVRGEPRIMAIGNLFEAKQEGDSTWAKGVLNKTSAFFNEVKDALIGITIDGKENKFLDAFSIEYVSLKEETKEIDGVMKRLIHSIKPVGVSLTGRPMNEDAFITSFYAKEVDSISDDLGSVLEVKEDDIIRKVLEKNNQYGVDGMKDTEIQSQAWANE